MNARLDRDLADLAAVVDFPPTPDPWPGVGARLATTPRRVGWWARLPRALVLALVALLALAAVAAALGLVPGLRLTPVSSLPADGRLWTRPALGEAVAVERVADHVPAAIGPPDEAYVLGDGEIVSLVYAASDVLPDLDDSGVGLLVQAIDGALDRDQVEKLVVEAGSRVVPVTVDGSPGYWIAGPPHLLRYAAPDDEIRQQPTRLVGDVLVWQRGGTLYRIESGLGMAETLRVGESIGR